MENKTVLIGEQQINRLGLGCMGMSDLYGKADEKENEATLNLAVTSGINFLDTSDFYGAGQNELLVGRVIAPVRDKIFLSVKAGPYRIPGAGYSKMNGDPDYLKSALAYSLTRLQSSYIDLYFPARIDPDYAIEKQMEALAEMKNKGFIRHIGLSEASAATVRKAHAVHPLTAVQVEYSLWSREPEEELLATLRELGILMVGYSPLSRGFLSGEFKTPEDIKDTRRFFPRFQGENFYRNLEIVEQLKKMAEEKNCSIAQLAIAWVLAQGNDVICLSGTKSSEKLAQNIKASDIHFSVTDLELIDSISPSSAVAGTRYPAAAMSQLNG